MLRYLPILALLLASPAGASGSKLGLSTSAAASLTVTKTCFEVTGTTATDDLSEDVPPSGYLSRLQLKGNTLAGGASTITWVVTEDAAGDIPLTDEVTETLVVGNTTATDVGANSVFGDAGYLLTDDGTRGSLYVCAKLDAGTLTGYFYLYWFQVRR